MQPGTWVTLGTGDMGNIIPDLFLAVAPVGVWERKDPTTCRAHHRDLSLTRMSLEMLRATSLRLAFGPAGREATAIMDSFEDPVHSWGALENGGILGSVKRDAVTWMFGANRLFETFHGSARFHFAWNCARIMSHVMDGVRWA